jgi:DNA-binding LytR/AlgR family response regulator
MGYSQAEQVDLGGLRVLIAEDEFFAALELAERIEGFGGEVIGSVAAAVDGMAVLDRERPDMAFLDVQLRDGFVTPLAAALQGLGIPFVLVTGYLGEELEDPALCQAPRLAKPYAASNLARIARLLRDEVVRRRAHALWEREGRPEGRAERHWQAAEKELRARSGSYSPGPPASLSHGVV